MNYGFNKNIVRMLGQEQCVKGIATVLAAKRGAEHEGPDILLQINHERRVNGEILANRCALYGCLKKVSQSTPKCEGL